MSFTLLMAPMAVAVAVSGATAGQSVAEYLRAKSFKKNISEREFETQFMDLGLLEKTLEEHGAEIQVISPECIKAVCCGGTLIYERDHAGEAFRMLIASVDDPDELAQDLEDLRDEYGMNVQEFTYNKVKQNLPENMHIAEEQVMDDDSIQLVIYVDEG